MTLQEALKVNGKARLPSFERTKYCFIGKHDLSRLVFDDDGRMFTDFNAILSEEWVPWEEPCNHEPEIIEVRLQGPSFSNVYTEYKTICKHCRAKLKATGWDEV